MLTIRDSHALINKINLHCWQSPRFLAWLLCVWFWFFQSIPVVQEPNQSILNYGAPVELYKTEFWGMRWLTLLTTSPTELSMVPTRFIKLSNSSFDTLFAKRLRFSSCLFWNKACWVLSHTPSKWSKTYKSLFILSSSLSNSSTWAFKSFLILLCSASVKTRSPSVSYLAKKASISTSE